MSLEVQKMAEGKPLTHFQVSSFLSKRMILSHWSKQGIAFFKWTLLLAMAMLRKALVASFIKPATGKDKAPEMKNTENR